MTHRLAVSVVSHGHIQMLPALLQDLASCPEVAQVLLTMNLATEQPPEPANHPFILTVVHNPKPQGFARNHNQAALRAFADPQITHLAVLNPDVRLPQPRVWQQLLQTMARENAALAAPQVLDPHGQVEDAWRHWLTPQALLRRALHHAGWRQNPQANAKRPDWVAGMCMLWHKAAWQRLSGFDESYRMYCEDMDMCWRARQAGMRLAFDETAQITHAAQRASHRNLQHMAWHLSSVWRFWGVMRQTQRPQG
jgi:N-acetylglucosaminyl-diphospho-decaprenol L-rhamnosyltransferase